MPQRRRKTQPQRLVLMTKADGVGLRDTLKKIKAFLKRTKLISKAGHIAGVLGIKQGDKIADFASKRGYGLQTPGGRGGGLNLPGQRRPQKGRGTAKRGRPKKKKTCRC
jgi:hypothetical protein